jgi:nucleoside permease NupC
MNVYNLISCLGILFFIGFLALLSQHKRFISVRVIIWGVGLQVLFAFLVFRLPFGTRFFLFLNDFNMGIIDSSFQGTQFLFGRLAIAPGKEGSIGFILAFQALPSIIFFSALMEFLYYIGIMDEIITLFAKIFVKIMGISGAEALCASAHTLGTVVKVEYQKANNVVESIINGSMADLKMVVGIGALLIALIGLISLIDSGLLYGGKLFSSIFSIKIDVTPHTVLHYIFYPFILAMGVPYVDAQAIARIIVERIIEKEVKSYQDLALLIKEGKIVYERSVVIATYALGGFAHIPSLAIFIGGTASIVPERTKDISVLGLWALFASNIACLSQGP